MAERDDDVAVTGREYEQAMVGDQSGFSCPFWRGDELMCGRPVGCTYDTSTGRCDGDCDARSV